jgi:hypothetical protein
MVDARRWDIIHVQVLERQNAWNAQPENQNIRIVRQTGSLDALTSNRYPGCPHALVVVNGQAERGVLLLDVGDQGWVENEGERPEDDEPMEKALEEREQRLG